MYNNITCIDHFVFSFYTFLCILVLLSEESIQKNILVSKYKISKIKGTVTIYKVISKQIFY